jgi:hypothetical protein
MAQLQGGTQYSNAVAVTPADGSVFYFLGFVVGVGGTITVRPKDSAADVQIVASAGAIYPIEIIAVRATGTAATGVVGLS